MSAKERGSATVLREFEARSSNLYHALRWLFEYKSHDMYTVRSVLLVSGAIDRIIEGECIHEFKGLLSKYSCSALWEPVERGHTLFLSLCGKQLRLQDYTPSTHSSWTGYRLSTAEYATHLLDIIDSIPYESINNCLKQEISSGGKFKYPVEFILDKFFETKAPSYGYRSIGGNEILNKLTGFEGFTASTIVVKKHTIRSKLGSFNFSDESWYMYYSERIKQDTTT